MTRFLHVMGARPNFPKVAPVFHAIGGVIVHTGQHYDDNMSGDFLKQLDLRPDYNLGVTDVPSMVRGIAGVLEMTQPKFVLVYGDTNSALAGAIATHENNCGGYNFEAARLVHIEAGLRSGDWTMPEESNRYVVDHLSDIHLVHCEDAIKNLVEEGIFPSNIYNVGNVMIDTLVEFLPRTTRRLYGRYALLTLHRPANVNNPKFLEKLFSELQHWTVGFVFPKHPRVVLPEYVPKNVLVIEPQDYLTFLSLERYAQYVITDSGGVQEETTYLNIPCFTLRDNTERPITVTQGTNTLCNLETLKGHLFDVFTNPKNLNTSVPMWDGLASRRIKDVLV